MKIPKSQRDNQFISVFLRFWNLRAQKQESISSTFYKQLLRQYIYANLSGTQQRAYSLKIGHNF